MKHQATFAHAEFTAKKKATRREKFLARMDEVIPWTQLLAVVAPHYPMGERGRPPLGLERMLRVYFLQQWSALADEALEDALYDSQALQSFAGIELDAEGVPDATTPLKFRRRLEIHDLCKALFAAINADLAARGPLLREGTPVDATPIAAPASTRNGKTGKFVHSSRRGPRRASRPAKPLKSRRVFPPATRQFSGWLFRARNRREARVALLRSAVRREIRSSPNRPGRFWQKRDS